LANASAHNNSVHAYAQQRGNSFAQAATEPEPEYWDVAPEHSWKPEHWKFMNEEEWLEDTPAGYHGS
jgi:hypothetical protein